MIIETALIINLNLNSQIINEQMKQDICKSKFEIVQEEKIKVDPETELLFMELFKVLDQEALRNMQNQKTN